MKSSITAHFESTVVATFNTKREARIAAKQMSINNINEIFIIGRHVSYWVERTAEYYCEGKSLLEYSYDHRK